jgi:GNAT superfamily N-acetyltransferase
MEIIARENELYQEIELSHDGVKIGEAEVDLKNHMLAKLVIFEPYQNQGFGTEVVEGLVEAYGLVNLWVNADNSRAIHVYEKCGFSRYHYIDKPMNKAAASYLITGAKGNPIAFIAFLNHTFKGCPNGLMVSRFVILPKYRGKGLSMPILSKVCGMLKANKKRVFINTENPLLGKALDRSKCFISTTFDHKKRKIEYDAKYAHGEAAMLGARNTAAVLCTDMAVC